MFSLCARKTLGVICLALVLLSASPGKLSAETVFTFTPRVWYSFIGDKRLDAQRGFAETSGLPDVPLAGGSISVTPEGLNGTTFSLTGLYGEGSAGYNAADGLTYIGKRNIERLDIEFIAQIPFAEGVFATLGGRYIRAEAETRGTVDAPGTFEWLEDNTYYLAEAGFGLSRPLDSEGVHRFFGSVTGMAGYQERVGRDTLIVPAIGTSIVNGNKSGGVFGFDTNVGYGFSVTEAVTFSARYRIFAISDLNFKLKKGSNFVHGPEVNLAISLGGN